MSHASTKIYDVIVIGTGVAGVTCAKLLSEHGISTLLIEMKKLPRNKVCSGILSPRGWNFVRKTFGEIPETPCLNRPYYVKGVNFCFPSGHSMPMEFTHSRSPQLWRKEFDFWALQKSSAEVHDEVKCIGIDETSTGVHVTCLHGGKNISYQSRYVIAADGPYSDVVKFLYPEFRKSFPFVFVGQCFYEGSIDLDLDFFHFFVKKELGPYSWLHQKDDHLVAGCTIRQGMQFKQKQAKFIAYLEKAHGLKIKRFVRMEGCMENYGASTMNRYLFGKGRILITGQASGFLNMMAEGMSACMHSAAHAAATIIETMSSGKLAIPMYESKVMEERIKCSDQWNPLKILFTNPHEADAKKAFLARPASETVLLIKQFLRFCTSYRGLGWAKPMLKASLKRLLLGNY